MSDSEISPRTLDQASISTYTPLGASTQPLPTPPASLVAPIPPTPVRETPSSTEIETMSDPSATQLKALELFRDIDKLERGDQYKMFRYRVKQLLQVGYPQWEHPLPVIEEGTKEADKKKILSIRAIHDALFAALIKKISDTILASYLHIDTVKDLIAALDKRFNLQTSTVVANTQAMLFSISGPVYQFDQTLDQLEQAYATLVANDQKPSDLTYIAAITKATPSQYEPVITMQRALTNQQNEFAAASDGKIEPTMLTPELLIFKLREAFTNWKTTNARQQSSGRHPSSHDSSKSPYSRGKRNNTQFQRGRGGAKRNTKHCYNCGKDGHWTKDCKNPLTDEQRRYYEQRDKDRKKKTNANSDALTPGKWLALQKAQHGHDSLVASTSQVTVDPFSEYLAAPTWTPEELDFFLAQPDANTAQTPILEASAHIEECDIPMATVSPIIIPNYTLPNHPIFHGHYIHIIDSGASIHITPYRDLLSNVRTTEPLTIYSANLTANQARLIGSMTVKLRTRNESESMLLIHNVYYGPWLNMSLISEGELTGSGIKTVTEDGWKSLYRNDVEIGHVQKLRNLYVIIEHLAAQVQSAKVKTITLYDLHKQMGHISYSYLKQLIKSHPDICTRKIIDWTEKQCIICIKSNLTRSPVPKQRTSPLAKSFGEHLHVDIWGPAPQQALGKISYVFTIVDDCTRWVTMLPLKTKDEAFVKYVHLTTELFTQYGIRVKALQMDNDSVFTSKEFTDYLRTQGTLPRKTVPHTPSQNGSAERAHGTVFSMVRANLESSGLPKVLWYHCVLYVTYVINRSPRRAIKFQTPYFLRFGDHFNIDSMHEFGAHCIIYIENKNNKLEPRGERGRWLGFADASKGHLVWTGHRIATARNIQFIDDTSSPIEGEKSNNDNQEVEKEQPKPLQEERKNLRRNRKLSRRARGLEYDETDINIAAFLTEFNHYMSAMVNDPLTFKDAIKHPHAKQWLEAMNTEIKILEQRKTWKYEYPPKGANVLGTRFVYKTKLLADGSIDKFKARLVVQGYAQKEGQDFNANDLYAPVARMSNVRTILSWAASMDFEIEQIDVQSAYLYGELTDDEVIYLRPPPGNIIPGIKSGQVLRLLKALYGLKQAGRRWYSKLHIILTKIGLTRSTYDAAVFYRVHNGQLVLVLFVHVDDITICGRNKELVTVFKKNLEKHVAFTDGGEIHWLLGIEIKRNRSERTIMLRQKHYIENIVNRFNFDKERSRKAPMETGLILTPAGNQTESEKHFMKDIPYMNMIGALRYAADSTRPDIAYPTGQLARYLNDPGVMHYNAAKHVFQYLKGTAENWLTLGGKSETQMNAYSDSDGMTTPGSKPIMGCLFRLGQSTIHWSSKRANLVTISVTEAEITALAYATSEAIYLKNFVNEVLQTSHSPTMIHCDNMSVLAIINSEEEQNFTQRTRHFEYRKDFFIDRIKKRYISVKHVRTDDQLADILTKALSADKIKRFTSQMRLIPA